jgi:hypothetical protein
MDEAEEILDVVFPSGDESRPAPAPGCAFKGEDTILHRPPEVEPEEILRPGLHEAGVGSHRVVWFDPSLLVGTSQADGGKEDLEWGAA